MPNLVGSFARTFDYCAYSYAKFNKQLTNPFSFFSVNLCGASLFNLPAALTWLRFDLFIT